MTAPTHIDFEKKIKALADQLEGRLRDDLLMYAVNYAVLQGENALAIETLCDFIVEYDVEITEKEFAELNALIKTMKITPHEGTYNYLRKLIVRQ